MAQYTLIGDPHCTPKNLEVILDLFAIVEKMGNPTIWLGDLLHTKEIIQSSCLNAYFHYFRESSLNHIVLVGNHDQHTAGSMTHALEPLKQLPNVTVIDKPTVIDNMLLLPYYHDLNLFRTVVHQAIDIDVKTLIMHQGINKCDYGNGFIAKNEVEIEELANFKRVISGHFHKYQERENLIYLGTPFSHSFGESNQIKYIATFDTEKDLLTVIPTEFPRHMTYEVDADSSTTLSFTPDPKNYNRVILKGMQTNISKFETQLYPDIKFMPQPTVEYVNSPVKESDSPNTIFTKWAKEIKKLDQETIDLGLHLLKDIQ